MTILELLKKYYGYEAFRQPQGDIIESIISGKDTFVLMPTGGGKSLCYQLPALKFEGITLVISPLIALMKDQVDALKANGISAEYLNSTLSSAEVSDIEQRCKENSVKLLYVAPERLSAQSFKSFLANLKLSLIAIDEAHCISEWGHDFRPDYRNLKQLRALYPLVPVIALTATATPKAQEDILAQLNMQDATIFRSSFNRSNLSYAVLPKSKGVDSLVSLLQKYPNDSSIIYCTSRKSTEDIATALNASGFKALAYHAGLEQENRKLVQEQFIKDEVQIITATIAFGMGIDKPNVRLVVHYDLPKTLEGYYQETGRAGRDGLQGECVLFYSYTDKAKQEFFINQIEDEIERKNAECKLTEVINYCETINCRRKFLLEYFGETWEEENCHGCNNCLGEKVTFDAKEIAQKILSAIIRTGERFGMKHILDVLLGRDLKRIREFGHDKLSVFGIVQNYSEEELKHIFQALINKKLIGKTSSQYITFFVTQEGRGWLQSKETLSLTKPVVEFEHEIKAEEYDKVLFEKLRILRRSIAEKKNVPPFIIFGDTTLQEMATYFPQNISSLSKIGGVGEKKLQEYGNDFLHVIQEYCKANTINEIPKRLSTLRNFIKKASKSATQLSTKVLLEKKYSIPEIAKMRGCTEGTVVGHIEKLIQEGEAIDIEYIRPQENVFAEIKNAFMQLEDTTRLAPAKQLLGEKYSYDEIRLVRLFL